jgi:ABC-type glycerol-3-phosphate transport system substrate-binding protein
VEVDKKFIFIAAGGLALVIILIIVLVSIGGKKGNVVTNNQPGGLVIWDYNNEKAAYDPVIFDFQKQYNVKVSYVSKNPASYVDDTINAIAAGNGPDIWVIPASLMPNVQDKLLPMPNNGFANATKKENDVESYQDIYPPVVAQDNIFNNQIYGVPLSIDILKLYINTNMVNEAISNYSAAHLNENTLNLARTIPAPKTWDDLVKSVQFLTQKNGVKITQAGITMGTANNIDNADQILTLLMMQNGAKMVSDDLGTAEFNTKQNLFGNVQYPGTKALQFYTSFGDPKSPNYTWNNSFPESVRAFAQGQVAMMINTDQAKNEINLITPNLQYQTIDIPQITETSNPTNLAQYDTLTVTKSAKNQKEAWRFILNATGSTYASSYFSITGKTPAANDNNYQVSIAKSWYNPNPDKVTGYIKDAIEQVDNGKDAQTAIDGVAGQVTTLLNNLQQNRKQ